MLDLLKNVYLLDIKGIKTDTERLWKEYQDILDNKNSSWKEINRARAILYFLGYIFVEKIALESLDKRIKLIEPRISLDNFLLAVDAKNKKILEKYKSNKKFNSLKEFYVIVKSVKNRINRDGTYLDEETFDKRYNDLRPADYF